MDWHFFSSNSWLCDDIYYNLQISMAELSSMIKKMFDKDIWYLTK